MIVAVLDTNVLASDVAGLARMESTPGELLRRWRDGAFILVVSEPILGELARTFTNAYFLRRLTPAEIAEALARFHREAHMQPLTTPVAGVATHPEDDLVLATAVSAKATYLVTGDRLLLQHGTYGETSLLTPRQFLAVLERNGLPIGE